MRPILLILAFLMSFSYGLNAQNNSKTMDGSKTKGVLYTADEQSIKISKNISFSNSNLVVIDSKKIDFIKTRRKGKIGKGAWIGAASGAGFGVAIGMATDSGEMTSVVATASGLFFGIIGTGVGAAVGSIKKRIQINGNSELYLNNLSFLQSISLVPKN